MSQSPRRDPGVIVRVGLALTLFNSWVLFEETVVDRLGWWQYMPCYRVGHFCEWDVGAILIILAGSVVADPWDITGVALGGSLPRQAKTSAILSSCDRGIKFSRRAMQTEDPKCFLCFLH